jgi:inorganic triphosphatase YgiF
MEIELKFQVPPDRRAALQRAVATAAVQRTRLRAIYADTADDRLAAAGLALRLRQEGRHWVQTLKGRGDGLMARLEHECRLPAVRGTPRLDPARHAGTAAGAVLARALGVADLADPAAAAALQPLYRTDIQRLHRTVRHGGARVEIALDLGEIVVDAAGDRPARRVPVCEIEFELLSGTPAALVALAQRWVQRFGLWWDVRTKSERGWRLARSRPQVPAVRAAHDALPAGAGPGEAWAAMLQATLAHALPNAAELGADLQGAAPADAPARADHVHQLRVALRRLRTVLALFGAWGGDAEAAAALQQAWREPFNRLGATRDADVLSGGIAAELQAAGAPPLPDGIGRIAREGPDAVVRDPGFGALLLQTLALSLAVPASPLPAASPAATHAVPLRDAAQAVLQQAWKQVRRDLQRFQTLPLPLQHRTRRRLKRLRYAWEFLQGLWPRKGGKRWFKALAAALEVLGRYNDLCVAEAHFLAHSRSPAVAEPGAWFALGWLAAQRPLAERAAAERLSALVALPRPWRKD